MKKTVKEKSRFFPILLTVLAVLFVLFILLPISLSLFDGSKIGNVAIIPIDGPITGNGGSYLGQSTTSAKTVVNFIKEAENNKQIKVILFEINSPGGSAVASDEIASAIKKTTKPTISVIREVGASGGYWIASATNHVIANRMSITGSIGVISSFLEFSGLMDKYGVGYEQLTAGEYKDAGTPYRKLTEEEKIILQKKINKIHDYFIEEIANNRNLEKSKVTELATGEFYLGIEALELNLIDQLGDKDSAEQYIKDNYDLEEVDFVSYQTELSFFGLLTGVFSEASFNIGKGLGSILLEKSNKLMLI
ncbi:signal peptide peptidase SppA [Candidatus Woesearchaeota archaeon]|jgi:protease IV|nr:signal peptide peptidase SppA [Candidatus Woesearchaeota archaeon]MBT6773968.1 signal peptide peptidase SppA [Candidatus Woesearchaeota archaeon]